MRFRLVTDAYGGIAATYSYDPYGTTVAHTGYVDTPFQYAGQYRDTETGLYYLRARYYDPATAQFLTRDPLTAVTRSVYGYVGGDPLNGSDPSGLMCRTNPFSGGFWTDGNCLSDGAAVIAGAASQAADTAQCVFNRVKNKLAEWSSQSVAGQFGYDYSKIGASCLGGALIGGVAGFFVAGVGAVPGAIEGCVQGLAIEVVSQSVPEDYSQYVDLFGVLKDIGDIGGLLKHPRGEG